VRALLRRAGTSGRDAPEAEPLRAGVLHLDLDRRQARVNGRSLELTYVEFELLRTLVAQPGKVFSRRALLQAIWGDSAYREPRTIDVHVRHLREKVEEDPSEPELILTVRGAGYRLREA
jgi:DNA-binding response OmpR family regulator